MTGCSWYCWQVGSGPAQRVGPELDAIQLSIFSHRFMSTAEQMGRSARPSVTTYYMYYRHQFWQRFCFHCRLFVCLLVG